MRTRIIAIGLLSFAIVVTLAASFAITNADETGNVFNRASRNSDTIRTYYIAADEVDWNYAPDGNLMNDSDNFDTFLTGNGEDRIGNIYTKALYREYTDDSFTTLKERPDEWKHLGTLGPVIRAVVGDTIVVHFKNNTRYPVSMHPHGVFYTKDSEGAPYKDGTTGEDKADDAVSTGGTHTYTWPVPSRAGPGPRDPSSIVWIYHSHTYEPADTNAGLVGPIIVTSKGLARPDGSPKDVDREFVNMFTVFDENASLFLEDNVAKFLPDANDVESLIEDDDFIESNLMHSINGYLFGNLPGLNMRSNERVRWYLIGMGTEVDLHTPHWHGATVVWDGRRTDVMELLPASMKVVNMRPDNVGVWMYHCHVNDHIEAGMSALFTVGDSRFGFVPPRN